MLNPEMEAWLSSNRETYEFYLLHAILHDPVRRSAMLSVPLDPDDFRREDFGLVLATVLHAVKVMRAVNMTMASPPTQEWLHSYLQSAGHAAGADRDTIASANKLIGDLMNPDLKEQWYCINLYFEAWYGSVQGKRIARKIAMTEVPDMAGAVAMVQKALSAAAIASCPDEEDEMTMVTEGTDFEMTIRKSTGIEGLDLCMNGGWGLGECSLLFGGTGGGKSVVAGQCAWHEALTGGYPLIVSTELRPCEYVARMVSCAATIPINVVQDCKNFVQIRSEVAKMPGLLFKEAMVDNVLRTIKERVRIAKVSPEAGMDAGATLEREREKYKQKFGRYPTLVILDWLGSMADVSATGKGGSAERAMAWEMSANSCVKFADTSNTPTLVLAQAVNDAHKKFVLGLEDIGIAKGIGKNMIVVIGVTNTVDEAGVKAALAGKAEMPKSKYKEDQHFCIAKARKGEGTDIPVRREFRHQRFILKPRT